jgi:hypothetical protein
MALVDQFARWPEEFRVQVTAADASQPASVPGQSVGSLASQRVATVFAADGDRYYRDHPHGHSAEKDRDCDGDYSTGHDGLPHFRPAEFLPQVPPPATVARRAALTGLVLVGHGVPICPRSVLTVWLAGFSPTIRLG